MLRLLLNLSVILSRFPLGSIRITPAEIMAILEPALRKRPHAEPHERECPSSIVAADEVVGCKA